MGGLFWLGGERRGGGWWGRNEIGLCFWLDTPFVVEAD